MHKLLAVCVHTVKVVCLDEFLFLFVCFVYLFAGLFVCVCVRVCVINETFSTDPIIMCTRI